MKKILFFAIAWLCTLQVQAQCTASFTTAPAPLAGSPLRIQVTNTSNYGSMTGFPAISTYVDYGDGSGQLNYNYGNNFHNYATPGTYTVWLKIKKNDSTSGILLCTDSTSRSVVVNYQPCAATVSTVYGANGLTTFTATNLSGTPGVVYHWDFGDGSPIVSGNPVSHTYTGNGYYTVRLYDTVAGTCSYTVNTSIFVSSIPFNCDSLHAEFSSTVSANTAYFNNTSTVGGPNFGMNTYSWNFGDGSTATTYAPTHTYAATGTYPVRLVMTMIDTFSSVICKDTIIHNVTISSVARPSLSGYVIKDSLIAHTGVDSFKVWLISFDSLSNTLTAIDSVNVQGNYYVSYTFTNVPAGRYRVKAAKTNAVVGTIGLVPTYHYSSLYWATASTVNVAAANVTNVGILMQNGTVTSGPGFVGGNVSLGANKGAASGVPGMTIYLRGSNNALVKSAITDANGDYQFTGVPTGTYTVYPEQMNYATTYSASLVVTGAQNNIGNINFNQDNATKTIAPRHTTSVGNVAGNAPSFSVYPNPARQNVTISWKNFTETEANLMITDIAGKVVTRDVVKLNSGSTATDISKLQSGIYFIKMKTANVEYTQKLIVAH